MKRLLLLVSLLVLSSCAGLNSNSGYTLYDDKVIVMAEQAAIILVGLNSGFSSNKEVQEMLTPMNQLINLSSNFNKELYTETYTQTTNGLNKSINQYSSEGNENSFKKFYEEQIPWTKHYTYLCKEMSKRIAADNLHAWNQQLQMINQLTNTWGSMNQSINNMNNIENQTSLESLSINPLSINPNKTNNYMINTNKGLVHKRCVTLDDGTFYCF